MRLGGGGGGGGGGVVTLVEGVGSSVSRWLNDFTIFGYLLQQRKINQWHKRFEKNVEILPNSKENAFKKCQRFLNFAKWRNFAESGHTGWYPCRYPSP